MTGRDGPIVVIKVGGSLFTDPTLRSRLSAYLVGFVGRRPVLIAGGGVMVDAIRDLDRIHDLGERRCHALALRVLDATADFLASLVPHSLVVDSLSDLPSLWSSGLIPIARPRSILDHDDRAAPDQAPLPHTWAVTSDSIAARIALLLSADGLLLLKSVPPPRGPLAPPYVDAYFSRVANRLVSVEALGFRLEDSVEKSGPGACPSGS